MTSLRRVPPGRAGRLWLLGRMRTGRLAATLLDRKLSILSAEQQRLRLRADRTATRWRECWREADLWAALAAALGAHREHRLCAPVGAAEVSIVWATVMGVRYPSEAVCRPPAVPGTERGPGTAAVVEATTAFGAALDAAVAHAAAAAAVRIVDDEVAATRRRLRAITDRWLPRLDAALTRITRELDETEREETFRLRWSAGRTEQAEAEP